MNDIIDLLKTISAFITALTVIGGAVIWIIKKFIFKPMEKQLQNLGDKIDSNRKDELRYTVLSFSGDLRNGIAKTRQEYETIFAFYDKYEQLIESLREKNGYLEVEMEYIKTQYKNLLHK